MKASGGGREREASSSSSATATTNNDNNSNSNNNNNKNNNSSSNNNATTLRANTHDAAGDGSDGSDDNVGSGVVRDEQRPRAPVVVVRASRKPLAFWEKVAASRCRRRAVGVARSLSR